MRKSALLYTSFALVALLAVLNFIAIFFYLYWSIAWYDIMMHFLGGLTVGVFLAWFLNPRERSSKNFLTIFVLVMVIGIGWEIFEYVFDIADSTSSYQVDTTIDFIMDGLGAITAYLYATTSRSLSQQSS